MCGFGWGARLEGRGTVRATKGQRVEMMSHGKTFYLNA